MVDFDTDGLQTEQLAEIVEDGLGQVQDMIDKIQDGGDGGEMNMGDMFSLQVSMNKFSQAAQVSTDVVAATQSVMMAMAKNVR
jgi:hypothetical protein